MWFSYSSLQSSLNTDYWTLVCYFYADTSLILPSWSVSKLRPAVPCAPANVPPGVLPNPTHTTHASASTAVRSVDFHVLCIIRQHDIQKQKKQKNFFDMQRHKYFHLQQMAIKKRPLSNVDAHLLFIAYCVFILFYFSVYWQLEDRVLMCICNRCCILKFKIIICPCSCTYWKLYWG